MARKEKNPNQIIRLDGNKCFMEALRGGFEIGKVHMNFFQYDLSRQQGNRFTAEIPIYMSIEDFHHVFYEIMISGTLIKKINALANDPTKKEYEKQIIISRGGKIQDGQPIARQLKIFKGRKKPIVLRAEIGKGQINERTGGYTMIGSPDRYIDIGMEYKDLEALMLSIHSAHIGYESYIASKSEIDKLKFEIDKIQDTLKLIAQTVNVNPNELNNILNREMPKPFSQNKPDNQQNNQNNMNNNQYYNQQNMNNQNYPPYNNFQY